VRICSTRAPELSDFERFKTYTFKFQKITKEKSVDAYIYAVYFCHVSVKEVFYFGLQKKGKYVAVCSIKILLFLPKT
jgi:hypothetical protein